MSCYLLIGSRGLLTLWLLLMTTDATFTLLTPAAVVIDATTTDYRFSELS